jgi:hypothetical protein
MIYWPDEVVKTADHQAELSLLPKFTGKNWSDFKSKLQVQFQVMGLHTFLQHDPRPRSRIDRRNDEVARAQIVLRLEPAQHNRVKKCKTTKQMWQILRKVYDAAPEDSVSSMFLDFIHLEMKSGQSPQVYLDQLTNLYYELALKKVTIGEAAFIAKALDGLTPDYDKTKEAARA